MIGLQPLKVMREVLWRVPDQHNDNLEDTCRFSNVLPCQGPPMDLSEIQVASTRGVIATSLMNTTETSSWAW